MGYTTEQVMAGLAGEEFKRRVQKFLELRTSRFGYEVSDAVPGLAVRGEWPEANSAHAQHLSSEHIEAENRKWLDHFYASERTDQERERQLRRLEVLKRLC